MKDNSTADVRWATCLSQHNDMPQEVVEVILIQDASAKEDGKGKNGYDALIANVILQCRVCTPQTHRDGTHHHHSHLHRTQYETCIQQATAGYLVPSIHKTTFWAAHHTQCSECVHASLDSQDLAIQSSISGHSSVESSLCLNHTCQEPMWPHCWCVNRAEDGRHTMHASSGPVLLQHGTRSRMRITCVPLMGSLDARSGIISFTFWPGL